MPPCGWESSDLTGIMRVPNSMAPIRTGTATLAIKTLIHILRPLCFFLVGTLSHAPIKKRSNRGERGPAAGDGSARRETGTALDCTEATGA